MQRLPSEYENWDEIGCGHRSVSGAARFYMSIQRIDITIVVVTDFRQIAVLDDIPGVKLQAHVVLQEK